MIPREPSRRDTIMWSLAGAAAAIYYFSWLLQPGRAAVVALFALLVACDLFNGFQAVSFWLTCLRRRSSRPFSAPRSTVVDALIPTLNEPREILVRTVRATAAMRGAEVRVWLLDDGDRAEIARLAQELGAGYLTRADRTGAKAGNLNNALRLLPAGSSLVCVFDADHVPKPEFLERTLGYLADERVALVQTPQVYANADAGPLSRGAAEQQAIFFGPICRGRDAYGSAFCCGTSFLARREALEEVGGFPEDSITEDIVLSASLVAHGYEIAYTAEPLSAGLGPEDVHSYAYQQLRWATGCLDLLLRRPSLWRPLSAVQRWQYFVATSYWLTGWTVLVYLSLPVLRLLFGWQPVTGSSSEFTVHFLPYFTIAVLNLGRFTTGGYSFAGLAMNWGSFAIQIRATLRVLVRRDHGFSVTSKRALAGVPWRVLAPNVLALGVILAAILIGTLNSLTPPVVNNATFALLHAALLGTIVVFALVQAKSGARRSAGQRPRFAYGTWGGNAVVPVESPLADAGAATALAAQLAGLGGARVRAHLLDRPGCPETAERSAVREHSRMAEGLVGAAPDLHPVAEIVGASAESYDGQGYPNGLSGEQIPLGARVVSATNALHARLSERQHEPSRDLDEAIGELREKAGHQFDPVVVGLICDELDDPRHWLRRQGAVEHDALASRGELALAIARRLEDIGRRAGGGELGGEASAGLSRSVGGVVRRRPLRGARAGVAIALALLAGVLGTYLIPASGPDAEAPRLADRFLDLYMEPSGRVVRRDQGGDTVSEGQAYAMLLATASDDQERFDKAWTWAKENLQRPDGLLSYHWAGGRVQNEQAATDADLDAAHALLVAAERFGKRRYRAEALRIAHAIMRSETVATGLGRVLVAGPWARSEPYTLNPSYLSPLALAALARETGDRRWQEVLRTGYELTARLTAKPPALAPDWLHLRPPTALDAAPPPGGAGDAGYGYDAARVPVRMAAACEPEGARLAARSWPFLGRQGTSLAARYRLDGRPLGGRHAVSVVAAAAAAYAAGERPAGERLLARAQALDRESPTYYGAAWVALGRVLLTTRRIRRCS